MNQLLEKILAETQRFNAALPELLKVMPGKWVVFRDGEVRFACDAESEAYSKGLELFGMEGGHVVAQVVPIEITPLPAGALFATA